MFNALRHVKIGDPQTHGLNWAMDQREGHRSNHAGAGEGGSFGRGQNMAAVLGRQGSSGKRVAQGTEDGGLERLPSETAGEEASARVFGPFFRQAAEVLDFGLHVAVGCEENTQRLVSLAGAQVT